jgi:hypothetical protein
MKTLPSGIQKRRKIYLRLLRRVNAALGDVSTLKLFSFAFNSSLIGFLAHTRFLNVISIE